MRLLLFLTGLAGILLLLAWALRDGDAPLASGMPEPGDAVSGTDPVQLKGGSHTEGSSRSTNTPRAASKEARDGDAAPDAHSVSEEEVVLLYVRDGVTLEELDGISVWANSMLSSFLSDAMSAAPLLADLRSPVTLSEWTLSADGKSRLPPWMVTVAVPGYVHGSLSDVDPRRGVPAFLELERAGSLEVRMSGAPDGATLRVWADSLDEHEERLAPPLAEVKRSNSRVELLENVRVGPVRVALESGSWWGERSVYAEARTEVVADLQRMVELIVPPQPEQVQVRVDVHLELPLALTNRRPAVRLYAVGPPPLGNYVEPVATDIVTDLPGTDRGSLDLAYYDVTPGTYVLYVSYLWSTRIDVPAEDVQLNVSVPDLALLTIRVTDPEGRELDPADVQLEWHHTLPADLPGRPAVSPQRYALGTPDEGTYALNTPGDRVTLFAHSLRDPLLRTEESIELGPGPRELCLTLKRTAGLVLKLVDGDSTVHWPYEHRVALVGQGGVSVQPEPVVKRMRLDGIQLFVWEPGVYTIEIPKLDGYLPSQARIVELRAGENVHEIVPMTRK